MKIHRRWMLGKRCALTGMLALAAAGVAQEGLAAAYGDMMRAASGLIRATAPAALPTPQQYISGFVLYVRWPDDAAIKAWQVCVAAPAKAGDTQYTAMVVRERPFEIRHVTLGDALATCQILDLTATDPASTAAFLKKTQSQRGLLIVGDGKDFCSAGGLICLRLREQHSGFEINLSAVKNAGFIINAKLLMMARQTDAEVASP